MPAPREEPTFWDRTPPATEHPPRDERAGRRRRALHPAIVASTAVLAVGIASAVGVSAFGSPTRTKAAAGRPAAAVPARGYGTGRAADAAGTNGAAPAVDDAPAPRASAAPSGAPESGAAHDTAPARPEPPPAAPKPPAGNAGPEASVLTLVNQQRAKAGCKPLTSDSRLVRAARGHSRDMADGGYFDHTTPGGITFDKRITTAGYRWSTAGENIAEGQQTAASVMTSWMNSPGHRANILNCSYTNIGVGLAYHGRTPFWTQDFAAPL